MGIGYIRISRRGYHIEGNVPEIFAKGGGGGGAGFVGGTAFSRNFLLEIFLRRKSRQIHEDYRYE